MNKLIIIYGDLATGKSTWSNMIGSKYHILVLNKDNIKEALADTIGFKNRIENKNLSHGTFEVMDYVLKKIAISNQDLILEANFTEQELKRLLSDANSVNYETLLIDINADIDILYDRFMKRANEQNRHPVHVTTDLIEYESFKKYILDSRKIDLKDQKIIYINANDFSYQNEDNFKIIDLFLNKR